MGFSADPCPPSAPPQERPTCGSCRFFVELPSGHCRRLPPVASDRGSGFPLTTSRDWCGEHQPREVELKTLQRIDVRQLARLLASQLCLSIVGGERVTFSREDCDRIAVTTATALLANQPAAEVKPKPGTADRCNLVLQQRKFGSWPRTCAECGLRGPCKVLAAGVEALR